MGRPAFLPFESVYYQTEVGRQIVWCILCIDFNRYALVTLHTGDSTKMVTAWLSLYWHGSSRELYFGLKWKSCVHKFSHFSCLISQFNSPTVPKFVTKVTTVHILKLSGVVVMTLVQTRWAGIKGTLSKWKMPFQNSLKGHDLMKDIPWYHFSQSIRHKVKGILSSLELLECPAYMVISFPLYFLFRSQSGYPPF